MSNEYGIVVERLEFSETIMLNIDCHELLNGDVIEVAKRLLDLHRRVAEEYTRTMKTAFFIDLKLRMLLMTIIAMSHWKGSIGNQMSLWQKEKPNLLLPLKRRHRGK
jgi:hypothetical protein